MLLLPALAVLLTLVLGGMTYLAFYLVGGNPYVSGPAGVRESWYLIYPLVALLAAAVGYGLGLALRQRLGLGGLLVVIAGAWLGQYMVLASGILADELNPRIAVDYWLLATAGPLQPASALLGGWLGLRLAH